MRVGNAFTDRVDHLTLEVRQTPIDVWYMNNSYLVRDPEWSFTDRRGHEHAYVRDRRKPDRLTLPTLWAKPFRRIDVYGEEDEYLRYYCRLCGQRIEPGWRVRSNGSFGDVCYIAGPAQFYVNGREVPGQHYRLLADALRRRMATDFKLSGYEKWSKDVEAISRAS